MRWRPRLSKKYYNTNGPAATLETIQGLIACGWRLIIYSVRVIAKIFHSHLHSHTQFSRIFASNAIYTPQIHLYRNNIVLLIVEDITASLLVESGTCYAQIRLKCVAHLFLGDNSLISGGRAAGITEGECFSPPHVLFSMCLC